MISAPAAQDWQGLTFSPHRIRRKLLSVSVSMRNSFLNLRLSTESQPAFVVIKNFRWFIVFTENKHVKGETLRRTACFNYAEESKIKKKQKRRRMLIPLMDSPVSLAWPALPKIVCITSTCMMFDNATSKGNFRHGKSKGGPLEWNELDLGGEVLS